MKNKIVRAGFVLLSCLLLGAATTVRSGNLYVYKTDGTRITFSTADLQKLEFSEESLAVIPKSGEEATIIPYTELKFFTLKDFPTGLPSTAAAASPIAVYPSLVTDLLTVTSATAIAGLNLYDLQGQLLLQLSPAGDPTVEVSLSAVPAGVYLLRVTDESGYTSIRKIIKK